MNLFTFGQVIECRILDTTDHSEIDCKFFLTRVGLAIHKVIPLTYSSLSVKRREQLSNWCLNSRRMQYPSGNRVFIGSIVGLNKYANRDHYVEMLKVV